VVVALVGRLTWWSPNSRWSCAGLVVAMAGVVAVVVALVVVVAVAGVVAVVADLKLGGGGRRARVAVRQLSRR
jgi:hypothetical protein